MPAANACAQADQWRSILFVPVLNDRFIAKACAGAADAVQLDLEDSILPADKARARAALPAAVKLLRAAGKPVSVRVNQPLELAVPDIEAALATDIQAIMCPKVLGPSHIQLLDELAARLERRHGRAQGAVRFLVALETPAAYLDARAIAQSARRIAGIMLGGEDFAKECGCEPEEDVMRGLKQNVLVAARAAGVRPMGALGSIADFRYLEAYEAMIRRSRAFGFEGMTCIHPAQVEVINRVYDVDADALAGARRIVAAAEAALASGAGAFSLDGRMIDAPIVERARRLLDQGRK